jgi:hypothetical protein
MTSPGFFILGCGGGMNQLTHQEQKIVALIAQGLTVTGLLSLYSPEPKVIMRKLELKNRVQVAYLIGQQVNIAEIAV